MLRSKWVLGLLSLGMLAMFLSGCGETVRGVGKDVGRVGRGVKTIFVSDN